MVGGAALDGGGHDLAGTLIGLLLGALLQLFDLQGGLVGDLGLHLVDQVFLGLLGGETGDALQHLGLAALDDLELFLLLVDLGVLGLKGLFFLLNGLQLTVEILFLLLQTALLLLLLGAAFLDFPLVFGAILQNLFLRLKHGLALLALCALDGLVDDAKSFIFGIGNLLLGVFRLLTANENTSKDTKGATRHQRNEQVDDGKRHGLPPVFGKSIGTIADIAEK